MLVDTEKTFNKVIVDKEHNNRLSIGNGDKMIVTDTLTLADGQVNVGRIESQADIVIEADWDGGGGTLTLVGPTTLNLDVSASNGVLVNTLEVNKPGSSVNLLSELMIDNITLIDGTFNGGSNTIDSFQAPLHPPSLLHHSQSAVVPSSWQTQQHPSETGSVHPALGSMSLFSSSSPMLA